MLLNGTITIINGGGNLGTLWPEIEGMFRSVISACPDSKIVVLPNTVYYENSSLGKDKLQKSIEIYNNHKNLRIYAREKISFDFMKNIYNDVKLFPDMVLYLNEYKETERKGICLLCLRNDCEKTICDEEKLLFYVKDLFGNKFKYTDMCVNHNISINQRKYEIDKKFEEFREADLVITDRLHGMIFAALTGTPCIVIDSKSPKIKGTYEWIKKLQYVKFAKKNRRNTKFMEGNERKKI